MSLDLLGTALVRGKAVAKEENRTVYVYPLGDDGRFIVQSQRPGRTCLAIDPSGLVIHLDPRGAAPRTRVEQSTVARRDLIRNLDALAHAERRIGDSSARLDGYYELNEGLIPAGSVAADYMARWDGLRTQHRALANEIGERLAEVQLAVIVWAIDAARGKGLLDGVALDPASASEWNTYGFGRPLPVLAAFVSRIEGQATGEQIACYVALGYTEETINGKIVRTPDMHGMIEVHTHSAYVGMNPHTHRQLNAYRGGKVERG